MQCNTAPLYRRRSASRGSTCTTRSCAPPWASRSRPTTSSRRWRARSCMWCVAVGAGMACVKHGRGVRARGGTMRALAARRLPAACCAPPHLFSLARADAMPRTAVPPGGPGRGRGGPEGRGDGGHAGHLQQRGQDGCGWGRCSGCRLAGGAGWGVGQGGTSSAAWAGRARARAAVASPLQRDSSWVDAWRRQAARLQPPCLACSRPPLHHGTPPPPSSHRRRGRVRAGVHPGLPGGAARVPAQRRGAGARMECDCAPAPRARCLGRRGRPPRAAAAHVSTPIVTNRPSDRLLASTRPPCLTHLLTTHPHPTSMPLPPPARSRSPPSTSAPSTSAT